jgi:hypothetical protein
VVVVFDYARDAAARLDVCKMDSCYLTSMDPFFLAKGLLSLRGSELLLRSFDRRFPLLLTFERPVPVSMELFRLLRSLLAGL